MRAPPAEGFLRWTRDLTPAELAMLVRSLPLEAVRAADSDWASWAHEGQVLPPGEWTTWVIKGGRSFGKTLAGSNWITAAVAERDPDLRIALVGATLDEARRVMVEGRSGLLAVADSWVKDWNPSLRRLVFVTGAEAVLFSGASPEQLRGPEHHFAWCDELAKWEKPQATWDMLQFGLRLGPRPRALVTTTPRPGPVLRAIMADPATIVTGGPSDANPHNSEAWLRTVQSRYAGTRLGRQELDGELLSDHPGALWSVELLERCRASPLPLAGGDQGVGPSGVGDFPPPNPLPQAGGETFTRQDSAHPESVEGRSFFRPGPSTTWTRVIIAVDPPSGDGTCGIIACAKDKAGIAHVLADHSVTARTPEGWARAVADAVRIHSLHSSPRFLGEGDHAQHGGGASFPVQVVAEKNQGGAMVAAILRTADPNLKVKPVTATVGKAERAAPVAMLFEAGKVVLHGRFPELEAELLGMIAGGGYEGPGVSPDRADAMVWGLTELMLGQERAPPSIRRF